MGVLQPWHLIVVLVIVVILFGPSRLPGLGESLGKGIRDFRTSLSGDDDAKKKDDQAG